MAEAGRKMNAGDYLAGREAQQLFGRDIATWFDNGNYDLLLTPTTPIRSPDVGTLAPIDAVYFTFPFNCTGQPASHFLSASEQRRAPHRGAARRPTRSRRPPALDRGAARTTLRMDHPQADHQRINDR
jgi:hypothetical protein